MLSKINICCIISDHFRTLRNFQTKKISISDLLLFIGVPIVASGALIYSKIYISENAVTTLLACFSILTGLLFSVLVLTLDLVRKEEATNGKEHPAEAANRKIRSELLHDTFSNISFSVLLAIMLALISVLGIFDVHWLRMAVSAVIYFGSANFVLTMLMVLKRIHVLLGKEIV
jgi:hypothetical protein